MVMVTKRRYNLCGHLVVGGSSCVSAEEGKLSSASICSDRDKLPSIRVGGGGGLEEEVE